MQEIFKGRDRLVCSALVKTSQGVVHPPVTVLHMLGAADTLKKALDTETVISLFLFLSIL